MEKKRYVISNLKIYFSSHLLRLQLIFSFISYLCWYANNKRNIFKKIIIFASGCRVDEEICFLSEAVVGDYSLPLTGNRVGTRKWGWVLMLKPAPASVPLHYHVVLAWKLSTCRVRPRGYNTKIILSENKKTWWCATNSSFDHKCWVRHIWHWVLT